MMHGDYTFSIPKDAPAPKFTPYSAGTSILAPQSSMDKIVAMEKAVIALQSAADPSYSTYLNKVLAQIRVAKSSGREFADSNYKTLNNMYFDNLVEIADETKRRGNVQPQYPKIPSLPKPTFPMPSDPAIVFDQPSVTYPTMTSKAPGTVSKPSVPVMGPFPDQPAKPSFFTSSGLMDLVNIFSKGWSDKEKIDAHSKLLTAQMTGQPVTVSSLVKQTVDEREARRFPWQWVIIGGIALGAVVVLASVPSRKTVDLTKTPVSG